MIVRLRLTLALLAARLVAWACWLLHYPGSSLPGVIALKLCPDAVDLMAPAYERVLAVTGTNGKTTSANLLAHLLRAAGFSVAHNFLGANMMPGVATALFQDRQFNGRPRSRIALIEADEGSVGKIFAAARPDLVIVTNFFRDQLDRYWELERTIALLRVALARLPGSTLVLNADDPLVAAVGQGRARARYFGVLKDRETCEAGAAVNGENAAGESEQAACNCETNVYAGEPPLETGLDRAGETREGRFCMRCGNALSYHYIHFGQLGDYFCGNCGLQRPLLDYAVRGLAEDDSITLTVSIRNGQEGQAEGKKESGGLAGAGGQEEGAGTNGAGGQATAVTATRELRLNAPLRGFYNVYNVLAATAAAEELGISDNVIQTAIKTYKPATGRMQDFIFAGRLCTLALIKNPVGANEVLKTLIQTAGEKALVIAINDLAADGRDVSWLWDADFACLAGPGVHKIICAGLRAADFAVCLKYAGVPLDKIELAPERSASLRRLAAQQVDKLYVLATYTNLFAYAKLLERMGRGVEQRAAQGMPSLS